MFNMDGTVEKLLDGLISVIGEEAVLFEKFLLLLENQQEALIANRADDVKAITAQLQHVVTRSQKLEEKRMRVVDEIRCHSGSADLNVSRICDMADAERSVQLRHLRDTVLSLYGRIEETRMRNGLLIEQSLEQIRFTLEMIGKIPAQQELYQKQGALTKASASLGVDRRM
jgi:flagellar biosynthesis/type III secretory pathway chaperone